MEFRKEDFDISLIFWYLEKLSKEMTGEEVPTNR